MKKILVSLIVAAIVVSGVGTAIAYDASNPWTGTVLWSIPSDTSFTITFAGAQTQVNFSASSANATNLEPTGQDAANNTPIIYVENTGNTALNFTTNLTAAKPTWATIKVSNETDNTTATEFDTAKVVVNASAPVGANTTMYLWTNISSGTSGDTTRTLGIYSEIA